MRIKVEKKVELLDVLMRREVSENLVRIQK